MQAPAPASVAPPNDNVLVDQSDASISVPGAVAEMAPTSTFTSSGPSTTEWAHIDPPFNRQKLDWVASVYVTDGTPLTHPYVSPFFGDFSGLLPFLIQSGEREMLRPSDEGARRFGIRAQA